MTKEEAKENPVGERRADPQALPKPKYVLIDIDLYWFINWSILAIYLFID